MHEIRCPYLQKCSSCVKSWEVLMIWWSTEQPMKYVKTQEWKSCIQNWTRSWDVHGPLGSVEILPITSAMSVRRQCTVASYAGDNYMSGWLVGCMMRSTHSLYDFPVVPDGTAEHHAEDHSYDLQYQKTEIIKQFQTILLWSPKYSMYL